MAASVRTAGVIEPSRATRTSPTPGASLLPAASTRPSRPGFARVFGVISSRSDSAALASSGRNSTSRCAASARAASVAFSSLAVVSKVSGDLGRVRLDRLRSPSELARLTSWALAGRRDLGQQLQTRALSVASSSVACLSFRPSLGQAGDDGVGHTGVGIFHADEDVAGGLLGRPPGVVLGHRPSDGQRGSLDKAGTG